MLKTSRRDANILKYSLSVILAAPILIPDEVPWVPESRRKFWLLQGQAEYRKIETLLSLNRGGHLTSQKWKSRFPLVLSGSF